MNYKIVIWGASGHARVVADIFRLRGCEILGFLDDLNLEKHGTVFCGSYILGGKEKLRELKTGGLAHVCIAIGSGQTRVELTPFLHATGLSLRSAIHPRAIVASDALVGAGTVVAAGAIINPNSRVGENVIINTGATIDHDCIIGDGCHICPGTHLAGNVKVGSLSWIGIGSVVLENVNIGKNVLLGAGAVVVKDIPDGVVAFGNPARVVRPTEASDLRSPLIR
jgi:acetyltransferase EpsM